MLTLFAAPKPFVGHIGLIQRNALRSWADLGESVEILLIGDEPGLGEAASASGARHFPAVERSAEGTPLLSSIFSIAHAETRHPLLAYANADILLLDDFLPAVRSVRSRLSRFLMVGQRWNLEVREDIPMGPGWQQDLRARVRREGNLHPPKGSDYFVFPRELFGELPPFALGRAGWDNWMIFEGRRRRTPVVDVSPMVTVVHQSHDYSHLPEGRPHYRHPESLANIGLAGGREAIFDLRDADWKLTDRGPVRKGWRERGGLRRVESDLISRLGSGRLAGAVRILFHPLRFFAYLRAGRPKPIQGDPA